MNLPKSHTTAELKAKLIDRDGIREYVYGQNSKPVKYRLVIYRGTLTARLDEEGSYASSSAIYLTQEASQQLETVWPSSKYNGFTYLTAKRIFAILGATSKAGNAEYESAMVANRAKRESEKLQVKAGNVIREINQIHEAVAKANKILADLGKAPIEIDLSDRIAEMREVK